MVLDTLRRPELEPAPVRYRSLGFREIAPYYSNPIDGVEFLDLVLANDLSH